MQKVLRAGFVVLCLVLVFSPGAMAFVVSNVTVDPAGPLVPGTPVIVKGIIVFPTSSEQTIISSHDLMLKTNLENPAWKWTLVLDGITNERPVVKGTEFVLSGFELSYPGKDIVNESVLFTLEGSAPDVTKSSDTSILRIVELDGMGKIIPGSMFERLFPAVNLKQVSDGIANERENLAVFKSHLDEITATGADTSSAELKYREAKSNIDTVESLPSTQYTTALDHLNAASGAINEGENLLKNIKAGNGTPDTFGNAVMVAAGVAGIVLAFIGFFWWKKRYT